MTGWAVIAAGLVAVYTETADGNAPPAGVLGHNPADWTTTPAGTPVAAGWTYDGTTWTPPPPTPVQTATQTVVTMADTLTSYIAQTETDAATLGAMTPAQLTTQPALDIQTRMVAGMAQLLTGIQALVVSLGTTP